MPTAAALLRLDETPEGGVAVLVTGPGQPGDKIDAWRHVALFKILDELPAGTVPVERERRRAPRVPFYVARGLTRSSAGQLVERLHAVGFDARIETRSPLAVKEVRRKIWAMSSRQAIGAGALFYMGPQFINAFGSMHRSGVVFVIFYPALIAIWGGILAWAARRNTRPLVGAQAGADAPAPVRSLAATLPRLTSRQDRRLVARVLERLSRIDNFGRGELADSLAARAAAVAEALASVDSARGAGASVSPEPDRALAELRREEVTRVVLRADLLRAASRLEDLCLIVARANAVDSADEAARLEEEIRELGLAVESEQEVASLLGARP